MRKFLQMLQIQKRFRAVSADGSAMITAMLAKGSAAAKIAKKSVVDSRQALVQER